MTAYWCWTEGEPATFRCRERLHDVRECNSIERLDTAGGVISDDKTPTSILATSARLRQCQQDLAASQQDLTRAIRERDEFIAAADKLNGEWLDLKTNLTRVEQQRDEARRLLAYALHLRQHGEHAPGGDETWAQFDRDAEEFLRWGPS